MMSHAQTHSGRCSGWAKIWFPAFNPYLKNRQRGRKRKKERKSNQTTTMMSESPKERAITRATTSTHLSSRSNGTDAEMSKRGFPSKESERASWSGKKHQEGEGGRDGGRKRESPPIPRRTSSIVVAAALDQPTLIIGRHLHSRHSYKAVDFSRKRICIWLTIIPRSGWNVAKERSSIRFDLIIIHLIHSLHLSSTHSISHPLTPSVIHSLHLIHSHLLCFPALLLHSQSLRKLSCKFLVSTVILVLLSYSLPIPLSLSPSPIYYYTVISIITVAFPSILFYSAASSLLFAPLKNNVAADASLTHLLYWWRSLCWQGLSIFIQDLWSVSENGSSTKAE